MGLLREMRAALAKAVLEDDPRQTILGTALLTFCMGVYLARPFDVLDASRAYRFMQSLPEAAWASLFIVVGSSKIVVCLLNAPLMRCPRLRYLPFVLNLSTSGLWLIVWAGIVTSNPHTLGTVLYFFMALAPAWASLRRFRAAREAP